MLIISARATIEHIGLEGRYGSKKIEKGDVETIKKAISLLNYGGLIILTIPYGIKKDIRPYHRVYNKTSTLLKIVSENLEITNEEFYKKSDNLWKKCSESIARNVKPTENSYALGLFTLRKS